MAGHGGPGAAGGSPVGGSSPVPRGSAASATCAGNLTPRRSLDVTRLGGVALPRTAPAAAGRGPRKTPGAPGPSRNPRPAGGGNDSRLESSIAPAAATHRAARAGSPRLRRQRCWRYSAPAARGRLGQEGGEAAAPRLGPARPRKANTCSVFSRNAVVTYFMRDGVSRDKAKPIENAETTCLSVIKAT